MSTVNKIKTSFDGATINGSTITIIGTNHSGNTDIKELSQFDEAIKRINAVSKLLPEQKECFIGLMNDAKTAIEKNDNVAKESCKKGFNMFKMGLGKTINVVLPSLANLTAVLQFFGLQK